MSTTDDKLDTTIVVVQRERFSPSQRSLESLLQTIPQGCPIIYVDNASPPSLREYLRQKAEENRIQLLRRERYESPLYARNSVVSLVNTEYVAFVDNDVLFGPGWLHAMLECARKHRADVVSPLIQQGELEEEIIHTAGGTVEIVEQDGTRQLREVQRFLGVSFDQVAGQLIEEPTQMAEFHCVLMRTEFVRQIGLFDANYLATSEHLDFALVVQRANGSMWFAPDSRVSYLRPPPVTREDRKYFSLRWSRAWVEHSERHLFQKWNLQSHDRVVNFAARHRRKVYQSLHQQVTRFAGIRVANLLVKTVDRWNGMSAGKIRAVK